MRLITNARLISSHPLLGRKEKCKFQKQDIKMKKKLFQEFEQRVRIDLDMKPQIHDRPVWAQIDSDHLQNPPSSEAEKIAFNAFLTECREAIQGIESGLLGQPEN